MTNNTKNKTEYLQPSTRVLEVRTNGIICTSSTTETWDEVVLP